MKMTHRRQYKPIANSVHDRRASSSNTMQSSSTSIPTRGGVPNEGVRRATAVTTNLSLELESHATHTVFIIRLIVSSALTLVSVPIGRYYIIGIALVKISY